MSNAATVSFHTFTVQGASTRSRATCSASMPGARRIISLSLSVGWISAIRGSSRCVTNSPAASTTIQARSRSKPVSISKASPGVVPAQDLIG